MHCHRSASWKLDSDFWEGSLDGASLPSRCGLLLFPFKEFLPQMEVYKMVAEI